MATSFSEEEREKIFKDLYEKGYLLLEERGMKQLTIKDLAESVGIGTGTFYNFFQNKEDFIIQLIRKRKEESMHKFEALSLKYQEGIPFEACKKYFLENLKENNIYRLLRQDEYDDLIKKMPPEDHSLEMGKYILSKLKTKKKLEDFYLFSEAYKIIVIGSSDISKLNEQYLDQSLEQLVHAACSFLY